MFIYICIYVLYIYIYISLLWWRPPAAPRSPGREIMIVISIVYTIQYV